jgi:hypothetical protein
MVNTYNEGSRHSHEHEFRVLLLRCFYDNEYKVIFDLCAMAKAFLDQGISANNECEVLFETALRKGTPWKWGSNLEGCVSDGVGKRKNAPRLDYLDRIGGCA